MISSVQTASPLATERDTDANQKIASIPALPYEKFVWGAGIECSFLPHLNINQFQWTQHDRFWREDFRRAANDLGITHLRYAFPWHEIEPQRGEFNWTSSDERIAELTKLGIEPMLDVMHFGTPLWLKQAVGDPEFPDALERFATAIVTRYGGAVKTWCPFNEPLVSALFSGDFGFWPPHSRKWRGYMPVLSRIVQGVNRGIAAIRRCAPGATVLLCDAVESFKSRDKDLQSEVRRRNLRRFLVMDLLSGKLDRHHPLFEWVTSYGMSELDLEWFRTHPQLPDVLGLDYYPHSDWQIENDGGQVRQRRADNPVGLHGVASAYYQRYGLPMMLTETSVDGKPINRDIWLTTIVDHIRRLREEGVPMLGLVWWPMIDQLDWDGALTHRIGKIHQVGLFSLTRQTDGSLTRSATPLVKQLRSLIEEGEGSVGKLDKIVYPAGVDDEQLPPLGEWTTPTFIARPLNELASIGPGTNATAARTATGAASRQGAAASARMADPAPGAAPLESRAAELPANGNGHASTNGNGKSNGHSIAAADALAAADTLGADARSSGSANLQVGTDKHLDRYGIVVFSHLRWGFVWQRPQQFLSRFAKKHHVLFVEEPFFDRPEGSEPDLQFHHAMPNVTVVCPHCAPSWATNPKLPEKLREFAGKAIDSMNDDGTFDKPLLWYYSPMDASWSLGHFANRGIVYDSMDELSQFTGAPRTLVANESRLMEAADVVFAGGHELWLKKKQRHHNAHFFGCGVEFEHFNKAQDADTSIPPDIDFMSRPILGWFGVVDERVDYALVGEMARLRPNWSFAMVGPVVKVDPNLLPHFPNLYWMGGRDYSVLPNYCKAFDVCMMAFAINAATQYINPTKALEYLATGRPVISTPVRDVVKQYTGLVEIARTAEEFIAAAERAMNNPDRQRIEAGIAKARANSWEYAVNTMEGLIREAVTKPDRPSARPIAPLAADEAQLHYAYQATQGS